MPIVKILKTYDNTNQWKQGDIVDCTNPTVLIEQGLVVLVDTEGNELARPGVIKCPICSFTTDSANELATHILELHQKRTNPVEKKSGKELDIESAQRIGFQTLPEEPKPELPVEDKVLADKADQLRIQRLANLAKGRAAKLAKAQAK